MTLGDALTRAEAALRTQSSSPRLDAELLLAAALGRDRAFLHAHTSEPLPADAGTRFAALLARRGAGEPVAYLLGEREFWSLALAVSPAVLIPRPETETLVAAALEVAGVGALAVADLGTGSGAVALALKHERPDWRLVATDRDAAALAVAQANAERHGLAVEFRLGDWCDALTRDRFGLVVSNPPYIPDSDPHLSEGDVRFEPRAALAAGANGLDAIRTIVACVPAHLVRDGWLLLEHGFDQADAVASLLDGAGFAHIRHWRDLADRARVTGGTLP